MASNQPEEESIGALIARLVEDGKSYGRAEFDYYRTLASQRFAIARNGLIAGAIAAVLGFATLIALLVGLILTLATFMHAGLATLLVIGGCCVAIYFLAMFARDKITAALKPRNGRRP
ncbi:phage holin family protein [Stakelama tenebrarum]|uniref:Phage holin family protein n=1 Tax=Stakelama tenebrarum TaxID=2711215 RepID=A0A6G6Y6D8_9SPHN|nr:phage holin family protein [Sphingosinithalassobacter tenebrarum]QIG80469.1 phage holin family protein [Sphingosinithalassobacter tenebrarum]